MKKYFAALLLCAASALLPAETRGAKSLREYFSVLKWGGETGSMKPRRLREVLDAFSISPQQATYIGDSVADIEDCRQVGVPVLSAAWAKCANIEALRRHNPEGVIHSPLEILSR